MSESLLREIDEFVAFKAERHNMNERILWRSIVQRHQLPKHSKPLASERDTRSPRAVQPQPPRQQAPVEFVRPSLPPNPMMETPVTSMRQGQMLPLNLGSSPSPTIMARKPTVQHLSRMTEEESKRHIEALRQENTITTVAPRQQKPPVVGTAKAPKSKRTVPKATSSIIPLVDLDDSPSPPLDRNAQLVASEPGSSHAVADTSDAALFADALATDTPRSASEIFCRFCRKQFSSVGGRGRHERIHTNERPYPCTYCEERFTRSDNRKHHWRKVHGGVMEENDGRYIGGDGPVGENAGDEEVDVGELFAGTPFQF